MNEDLEKYRYLKEYLVVGETEMKKMLRMVDAILEDVESMQNMQLNPQLCLNVRDQAVRIRSALSSRLVALEDLITILRGHGMEI
jgi:hypothetical protein